jgi:hypothetical protein
MPNADRIMAAPENLPPEELRRAAETYTSPYDVREPQKRIAVAGGLGVLPINTVRTPNGRLSAGAMTAEQRDSLYSGYDPDLTDFQGSADLSKDDVYGPKYVDPKVQELMRDIDKRNKQGVRGIKSIPGLGRVVEGLDFGRGLITGKKTTEADADLKRAYMQGNSAQRAELEAKYPNLTKFAQMAGEEPQLPMSNYNDWRQKSFGTGGGGGGSTSITSQGGGTPDIGSGGKNEPIRVKQAEKETTKPKPKPKGDGRRPAIYYKWDLGVSVPSPTDSDYTLYLKYLQEKAAAKAGVA